MALAEGLLQSQLIAELSLAVQRLMPEVTDAQGVVNSGAWSRMVAFEPQQPSNRRAAPRRGRKPAAAQHASVATAVDTLLRQLLELVVRLVAWLECAGVAAEWAGASAQLQQRVSEMQRLVLQQLVATGAPTLSGKRQALDPATLLHQYATCTTSHPTPIYSPATPGNTEVHLGLVLRPPVSTACRACLLNTLPWACCQCLPCVTCTRLLELWRHTLACCGCGCEPHLCGGPRKAGGGGCAGSRLVVAHSGVCDVGR